MLLSTSIPVTSAEWQPIGPSPIAGGGAPGSLPTTGPINAIATDPADPNTMYVAAAGGGVWKTTNGGSNWLPLTDNQATLVMGSIAVSLSNPNTIYAGTGDPNQANPGLAQFNYTGQGVLKSTDGGNTWTLLNDNGKFSGRTIGKVVVNPTNPNIVYAEVSNSGTNGQAGNLGVYRSNDGGQTWLNTTATIIGSTNVPFSDLIMNPSNPLILDAAIAAPTGNALNGVYQTTDGGTTWALQGGGLPSGVNVGRISLAIAPGTVALPTTTTYASIVSSGVNGTNPMGTLLQFLKSTDGGVTWTDLTSSTPSYLSAGNFGSALAVNPLNPQIVFAGGSGPGGGELIESESGGQSWTNISLGADGKAIPNNQLAFVMDSSNNLLAATEGGLFRFSDTDGNPTHGTWTDLNGDMQITQFQSVALDPNNLNVAYGGAEFNSTVQFNDDLEWNTIRPRQGGQILVDPKNSLNLFHTFSTDSTTGLVEKSTDGGVTWTSASSGINITGLAGQDPSNFYPPLAIDPSNSARLFVGTNVVYETTNAGASWTAISKPNTNGWTSSATIDSIAVAPSDPNTIYAATSDGHVFVTQNNGTTWSNRSIPTVSDALTGLVISPTNSSVAYVVRSGNNGASASRVFTTNTTGLSWSDITGTAGTSPLPNIPTWSTAIDWTSAAQPIIFVGTDQGVWSSSDGGTTWAQFRTGLPNAQVLSLQLNTKLNILAAGTNGRGMFEIKEINPLQVTPVSPPAVEGTPLSNIVIASFTDGATPDPVTNYSANINWGDGHTSNGSVAANGSGGFNVTASHTYADEMTGTISITVTDIDGDIATVTEPVTVADAPLTPNSGFTLSPSPTEGQSYSGTVGTFVDGNTAAPASDFTARITWGDGHTSNGTVAAVSGSPGTFGVSGTNTYAQPGNYPLSIAVTDKGGATTTITGAANVIDAALTASAVTFSATEGNAVNTTVATFTDADPGALASYYTAIINWGDGTAVSNGVISGSAANGFVVTGSHTYGQAGKYQAAVTIIDASNGRTATDPTDARAVANSTANVADARLTAAGNTINGTEGQALAGSGAPLPVLITFTDANPKAQVSDFASVLIDWGDGSSSVGTIAALGGGKFSVAGNHTYAEFGTYTVSVPIVDTSGGRLLNDPSNSKVTGTATAVIADASLNGTGVFLSGTAGQPLVPTGQPAPLVATFTDANPNGSLGDLTATINWGDGTPSAPDVTTGVITQPGGVGTTFNVTGNHTYTGAGSFSVTVTISDVGGATATANTTATIADAALTGSMASLNSVIAGGTFVGTVATFHDANTFATAADFLAPITWGDGNSSLGTITPLGNGDFSVSGFNTYLTPGIYTVTVDITSLGGSQLNLTGTATVKDAPIIPSPGAAIATTEGTAFSGQVATFTQSALAPPSNFTATIDWGDGTTTTGQVVSLSGGVFGVNGNTTYPEEGTFTAVVTINSIGGSTAAVNVPATVADAQLTASAVAIQPVQGQTFSGVVANFTDANIGAPASDFTASISWGNGKTAGAIVSLGGGSFQVTGTNVYTAGGSFPLSVTINDVGGSSASASATAHVVVGLTGTVSGGQFSRSSRPTFSGRGEPGTTVQLFAVSTTTHKTTLLGQTKITSAGTWTLTGVALADGSYVVTGKMTSASGTPIQTVQLLPSGKLGPLTIDTTGPNVMSAQFIPSQDKVVITYHDAGSGMNTTALANAANTTLALANGGKSFQPTHVSLVTGPAGSGLVTETVTYNLGANATAGQYVLTINGANVTDRAGNRLVEKTFVTFPQTSNQPNPNYVAAFNVNAQGQASAEQPYISLAEQRAAAQYLRLLRKKRP